MARRITNGEEPRWDITAAHGAQAEMFVFNLIEELQRGAHDIEVKYDQRAQDTGNVYIEYKCLKGGEYVPSGIATTEAKVWVFVLECGDLAVLASTDRLRVLAREAAIAGRIGEQTRGSHPTRGALVPVSELLDVGTKAMRGTLTHKYGGR